MSTQLGRRGDLKVIVGVVLALVFLWLAIGWATKSFGATQETTEAFALCEGLGTFFEAKEAGCYAQPTCPDTAEEGYYWFLRGPGFGCPDPREEEVSPPDGPYCCFLLPDMTQPPQTPSKEKVPEGDTGTEKGGDIGGGTS